jgi:hypothetical protein
MGMAQEAARPPPGFRVVGAFALIWNAIGIVTFLWEVAIDANQPGGMSNAERQLFQDTPAWSTVAYAVAVFAGTAGCLALIAGRSLAIWLLAASLAGVIVQMGQAVFLSEALSVRGPSGLAMPLLIVAVAAALVWFAAYSRTRGWIVEGS